MNIIFIDNWINIFLRFDFIAKRYFKIRLISYNILFCVLLYIQELNFNTIIVLNNVVHRLENSEPEPRLACAYRIRYI
jgi:hypothetical protein